MSSQTQSNRIEVLWSPNREEDFATYSTELRIHSLQDLKGNDSIVASQDVTLSSHRYGKLIGASNSDVHCMPIHQGVAWQTNPSQPYFFAVGQNSGRVTLTNLDPDTPTTPKSHPVLAPRSGRPCTCLAWNPSENHLLAVGLDKARNDSSLVVWDITRASTETAPATPSSERTRLPRFVPDQSTPSENSGRYFEIGHGEATSSIAWLPNQSNCLVAGMGTRFLRTFDIRDEHAVQTHPREVASHKAILGLCVDPTSTHQLATYAEGATVFIWDIRHFAKPAYSFTRPGTISRLSWLPTRPGCLSVVVSESPYLRLVDIPFFTQSANSQVDTAELYSEYFTSRVADRCPYIPSKTDPKVTGVAWHSKWENTGIISTAEGGIKEIQVFDKMPLSWTASEKLVYGSSSELFAAAAEVIEPRDEDISTKMKERIKRGYCFEPASNIELLDDDQVLHDVWNWLELHRELTRKGLLPLDKKNLPGVCSVLGANRPLATDFEGVKLSKRMSWHDREGVSPSELPPFPTWFSPQRQTALLLCGWSFVAEGNNLEDYLKREELNEHFERAATIAVFQGRIRRAIASLKDGAGVARQRGDTDRAGLLNLIALALSGYSPQETRLWYETCAGIKAQIRDPYLRGAFNFLCSTGSGRDQFVDVTNETEMSLQDRVAFACMYMDDGQLHSYIHHQTKTVLVRGHISGLFLTGLTSDGIKLLTNYVDVTGDVQTACLIVGQVMPFAGREAAVKTWFQGYRDLLDQWQMWHERAKFDNARKKLDPALKLPKQAFVMCSFCSKSISSDSIRQDRRSALHSSAVTRKATSCPNCRKPLPRCSLCLLNMVATGNKPKDTKMVGGEWRSSDQFGQWFTWCQSCRHGGHANHIAEWFSDVVLPSNGGHANHIADTHQECPVTGCSCHCFSLDTID